MKLLTRTLVRLTRIHHSRGFGIQSPTDYAFVCQVLNEHWPYYAYSQIREKDWLRRKLGRLYLRLANWRRPAAMLRDEYQPWFQAGCAKTVFYDPSDLPPQPVELARINIAQDPDELLSRCDRRSVVIVEGIHQATSRWRALQQDRRVGTTFDLYDCAILFFDTTKYKHHYIINF